MTMAQIEENSRCLLREWPKDDRIPFPRDILEMLEDLKKKVRTRDEKREEKTNEERTTREAHTDACPPMNRMPVLFDWVKDVNESNGLSLAIPMNTKLTTRVDEAMAEAPPTLTSPVAYSPRHLSALSSGSKNPWATLSRRHHRHHCPQPPRGLPVPNYAT